MILLKTTFSCSVKKLLCIVCAAFVVSSLLSSSSYARCLTRSEYGIFTEAKRHVDSGKFEHASAVLERYFTRSSSKHSYGYELYGVVLLQVDKIEKAVRVLQQGFSEYPENVTLAQNLGTALYRSKKLVEAADAFMAAYRLSGEKRPSLAYSAAVFWAQEKQYGKAATVMHSLVEHAEAKSNWHLLLAQCLLYQKKAKDAEQVMHKAIARYPEEAKLWRMLGFVYFRQGQREKAAATYEVAYKVSPPSQKESSQLASLYCALGAPSLGKRVAAAAEPNAKLLDNLAFSLARMGDLQSALLYANQALQQKASDKRRFRKAQILMRMKRDNDARTIFTAVAKGKGKLCAKAQWVLAIMAWNNGEWKLAKAELEKLLDEKGVFKRRAQRLLAVLKQVDGTTKTDSTS